MDFQTLFDRPDIDENRKLIDGPSTFTYGAFYKKCRQVHSFFSANGFVSGDRIGIATQDEIELCCLFLCCLRFGLPVAVIDPASKKAEVTQILDRLQLKALFLDQPLLESWQPAISNVWILRRRKSKLASRLLGIKQNDSGSPNQYPDCLEGFEPAVGELPDLKRMGDQPALLLCTSGTTGLPKILQLNLANLLAATEASSRQLGFNSEMRMLNLLSLTHYDGVIFGLFTAFYNSATLLRLSPFAIPLLPDILDALYQYRATHLLLTPAILRLMLALGEGLKDSFRIKDFQYVISVAATLPPKLWSNFEEITGKRIVNVYGLSESGNLFFAGPDDDSRKIGSIGKPVGCNVAIIGEGGQRMNPGETGELLLEGPSIASRYLSDPIKTTLLEGTTWFSTGDLAYCDGDGTYWLAGRKKNIILVGGRNVYPDEINNTLLSYSGVREAATLGLPDEIWGERVVSCVVAEQGISSSEVLDYLAKNLSDYKVPREIHFLPELPKTRSGKVSLTELELHVQASSRHQLAVTDLEERVLGLAAESFRIPGSELSLKSAPANCSRWDSVAHMDFVTNLETNFGVELLPREIIQITTIEAAVRIIREKLNVLRVGQ